MFLKHDGKMFPNEANLYIMPFSDDQLYARQLKKAKFWENENFYGLNLSSLKNKALD